MVETGFFLRNDLTFLVIWGGFFFVFILEGMCSRIPTVRSGLKESQCSRTVELLLKMVEMFPYISTAFTFIRSHLALENRLRPATSLR